MVSTGNWLILNVIVECCFFVIAAKFESPEEAASNNWLYTVSYLCLFLGLCHTLYAKQQEKYAAEIEKIKLTNQLHFVKEELKFEQLKTENKHLLEELNVLKKFKSIQCASVSTMTTDDNINGDNKMQQEDSANFAVRVKQRRTHRRNTSACSGISFASENEDLTAFNTVRNSLNSVGTATAVSRYLSSLPADGSFDTSVQDSGIDISSDFNNDTSTQLLSTAIG
ncbi:uncharacterized protein LOC130626066 [Hydractinia symbiolongicarpus]|uniref:uncharacterized protein LOC130626066 n=1 Tax=Hydractinia symbiolongicarpus TaxID=13093 RepID=UPI002550DB58|nr:uncharacterized protein LOC130626066 [Hydractinia symbiolongicarpus]